MQIVKSIKRFRLKNKRSVVTIGIFDGVHLGHREIIKKVIKRAGKLKAKSVVLTFDPHPAKIIKPHAAPLLLISLDHKLRLIEELGVDICVVLEFKRTFSLIEPEKFVREILAGRLKAREIIVGPNFNFGKNKQGNISLLKQMGKQLDFKVNTTELVKLGRQVLSSTKIRQLIQKGNLNKAQKFLGRPVAILGTVVKGSRLGRFLGYPTANIDPHHEIIPPSGVYAVRIRYDKGYYKGILNIGRRPTFLKKEHPEVEPTIEVHIFNFKKKIYGKDLEIEFVKKIRKERKFPSKRALIEQIRRDEAETIKILGK